MLLLFVTSTLFAKDKITVKIIDRQDKEQSYDYVAVYVQNTNSASAAGATFTVTGATLTLELPDGRVAVVNCAAKFAEHFAGPIGNRRSCRVPLVNEVQAEFKGDGAKLEWSVSLDGKKMQSETYKILGVFDKK